MGSKSSCVGAGGVAGGGVGVDGKDDGGLAE